MAIFSSVFAVLMAGLVFFIRMKAAEKPTNAKKIILPPIFMSTGALMFVHPMFRVTALECGEAIFIGALFSILLIKTSSFEVRGKEIYLQRSKAFVFIFVGLIVLRLALKTYLSRTIEYGELAGMFWILAFSMIVPWRVAMYVSYRRLQREIMEKS
ncbi:membrane protein [Anoxybacillus gonensis]|uniref:Cytochrome c biogenesis protein CcdC n=1 Tax=Anoxybacillus gonensis TaxID=198467 RepID=A0AAW7TIZ4_9BACL|nr:cytochrome c biogenesis protein CcdC [Anoxybacillus gonensis]AKS38285.1 membrane protein [Anoxybacillus gonensis]KGP60543.1 membrane protein [Anoxybacillus gonensis]MDO0877651.1 cytochrome c biogenesis protein CcdC [Anoxybacillus gonensis]